MSSWGIALLMAVQATCVPGSAEPAEDADAVATVRTFFELGNDEKFEAVGALIVPGAVVEDAEGTTRLMSDGLDEAIEEGGGGEPTHILDIMSAPGSVAVKATSDGETAILHFKLSGVCISRVTYL